MPHPPLRHGRAAAAALAAGLALAGCGADLSERYRARHGGWEPAPPAVGQPAAAVLAGLAAAAGPGREVELRELRVVDRAREPWARVSAEALVEGRAEASGALGVTAVRRCEAREGLSTTSAERASWYLFEGGRLTAFDHVVFGEGCATELRYRPAQVARAESEQALARYAAQRARREAPAAPEPLLRRGLALARAGRLEEADERLLQAERALRRVEAGRDRLAEGSEAREAASERLRSVRRLRAELERRLEEARKAGKAREEGAGAAPEAAAQSPGA